VIFNIVFFLYINSIQIQGTTLSQIAHWLQVALPEKVKQKSVVEEFLNESAKTMMTEIRIPANAHSVGKKIVDLHLPASALIALINRDNKLFTPKGSTEIQEGDLLIVLSDTRRTLDFVYNCLSMEEKS